MRPKFEVGEVVILQSVEFPECNGDCTVIGLEYFEGEGFSYLLDINHVVEGYSDFWLEACLRKKHIPGELSFTDLMASLSSPVLITHQP